MLDKAIGLGDYLQGGVLQMGGLTPMGIDTHGNVIQNAASLKTYWRRGISSGRVASGGVAGGIAGMGLSLFSDSMGLGSGLMGGMVIGGAAASIGSLVDAEDSPGLKALIKRKGFAGQALSHAMGLGSTAYFTYQGWQENGLEGARDALVWDLATNAALARFGYKKAIPEAGIGAVKGTIKMRSMLGFGVRGLGAAVGGAAGQAVGGTIGTFAGAYVGAAPMSFVARNPALAVGAIAAGTVAAAGYGAYHVVKQGYSHAQRKKGIQTSGSMAAFMTSGANTMRARAVQAMHKSHLNARSALGQEASFMNYPSRNYHSRYRM